jgi:hypothetical protein
MTFIGRIVEADEEDRLEADDTRRNSIGILFRKTLGFVRCYYFLRR